MNLPGYYNQAMLALALALAGVPQRGPTPTTRTAGLSHVAVYK